MKISKKRTVQVMVFAIALLLVLALSIGITGAWYQAKRQASGTVIMDQGIIIDYQGFAEGATATTWGKGVTLNLFAITDAQPGQEILVNASSIKANEKSVDFYARVKLGYKFYNGDEEVTTLANPSDLITTSTNFFGANWVESQNNDGWFYYGTGTTLGKLTPSDQDTAFVALFADGAKFVIEGANFVGADNGQGGGFVVDETTSINKIVVTLTLETLQGSADAAAENWSITPILRVDISDLTSNTQIEDIVTIDPTMGDVYLTGNPVNPVEISIGSRAFAGCSDLGLNLSNAPNATYIIANDAFESAATVNYGSTNIKDSITSTSETYDNRQLITGTRVYAYQPTAFTPTPSTNTTYGTYQYTDGDGNIWYYDLIDEGGTTVTLPGSALSANTLASSTNVSAKIKYVDNNSSLTTLTIPQYIQSSGAGGAACPVTVLDTWSIYGPNSMIKNAENIRKVIIPVSITKIEKRTFYQCGGLTSITIPGSVTSIGSSAFNYCSALTSVIIDNGVTSIGAYAFNECNKLTSVTIPNSVISIGDSAFSACTKLTSVTIGDGVTSIGSSVFSYCSGLEKITVGSGNTKYHSEGNCIIETASKTLITGCKTSVIPTDVSVTSIGNNAFAGCSGLTSITIPSSVTSIGSSAFGGCSGLTSITIPNSVTSIGQFGFSYCSGLTSVTIQDGVVSIGWYAFNECNQLKTITIPSSVENIGSYAFSCSGLTEVVIDSSTIAGKQDSSNGYLLSYPTKVYVKTNIIVINCITSEFTKQSTSDREGYDLYTK